MTDPYGTSHVRPTAGHLPHLVLVDVAIVVRPPEVVDGLRHLQRLIVVLLQPLAGFRLRLVTLLRSFNAATQSSPISSYDFEQPTAPPARSRAVVMAVLRTDHPAVA